MVPLSIVVNQSKILHIAFLHLLILLGIFNRPTQSLNCNCFSHKYNYYILTSFGGISASYNCFLTRKIFLKKRRLLRFVLWKKLRLILWVNLFLKWCYCGKKDYFYLMKMVCLDKWNIYPMTFMS